MTMCRKESQPCYAPATLGQGEVESGKREISVGEELGYRGKWRVARGRSPSPQQTVKKSRSHSTS